MPAIHCIEQFQNVRKIDKDKNEWEIPFGIVSEEIAQQLVGGFLYLHETKAQAAYFGGEILSWRTEEAPKAGQIVFKVRATMDCKGVKTDGKGWRNGKKILPDASGTP